MGMRILQRVSWPGLRTKGLAQWRRLRRRRLFLPAVVAVPALALSGGLGGYAAWDSTRVDIPDVLGLPWADGVAALEASGLVVDAVEAPDGEIDANCYSISEQDVAPGTRVVPDDTSVALAITATPRQVPDVIGMSLAEARTALLDACLHLTVLPRWCLPDDYAGGESALTSPDLAQETGFSYEPGPHRLTSEKVVASDSWRVCEQSRTAQSTSRAGLSVPVAVVVPLTSVPAFEQPNVEQVLAALGRTGDGCALTPRLSATFPADPSRVRGVALPPVERLGGWSVSGLTPPSGHAALCGSTVEVQVDWPSATMPQLLGLHHVPDTASSATPATATLEGAGLRPACSGRGTVTSQVPAAGAPVPVGTAVTCVAELVVPNIVGLDPVSASAALAQAGLSSDGLGSGVVVSQSPQPGEIVTGVQKVSYRAEQPPPAPSEGSVYYKNCDAARAAGAAPIYRGQPGYRPALDRDDDGIACE